MFLIADNNKKNKEVFPLFTEDESSDDQVRNYM